MEVAFNFEKLVSKANMEHPKKSVLQIFVFSIATVMEIIMRIWVHFEDICGYHGNQVTTRIT